MVRVEKEIVGILFVTSWIACAPETTKTLIQMPAALSVSAVQLAGNTLTVTGSNFEYIQNVSLQDLSGKTVSDLSDLAFTETYLQGTLKSSLSLAIGTVYHLVISNAAASTAFPLTLDLSHVAGAVGIGMTALNDLDLTSISNATVAAFGVWGTYGSQTTSGTFPGSDLNPFANLHFYNKSKNSSNSKQPIASVQAARNSSDNGALVFFANSFSGSTFVPNAVFAMTDTANFANRPLGVGLTATTGTAAPGAEFDVLEPNLVPTQYAARFKGGATPATVPTTTVAVGGGTLSVGGKVLIGQMAATNPSSVTSILAPLEIVAQGDCTLAEGAAGHGLQIASGRSIDPYTVSSTVYTDQMLYAGVDPVRNLSYLQSVDYGTATSKIALNARGGGVSINTYSTLSSTGIASPALSVNGGVAILGDLEVIGAIRTTGTVTGSASITFSDARMKSEIQNSDLGLEFINHLRPVSYRWKANEDRDLHYGLIAQETEKSVQRYHRGSSDEATPIIAYDAQTDRYGMKYSELISPIIQSIQEFYSEYRKSMDRIHRLETENESLKRELSQIRGFLCAQNSKPSFCR